MCVCISLCTIVVHNTAQNSSDNLPSKPPEQSSLLRWCLLEGSGPIIKKWHTINTISFSTRRSQLLAEDDSPLPRWVLMLMYLAVPVRLLCSRYGMCLLLSGSMYSLARPKSITYIVLSLWVECRPIRKFSGFMSRLIRNFEWMNSIRRICIQIALYLHQQGPQYHTTVHKDKTIYLIHGSAVEWLGHWTCNSIVTSLIPGHSG